MAVALVDPAMSTPRVGECTAATVDAGVDIGLTPTQALARCREIRVRHRSTAQEREATDAMLQAAYAFSPNLEVTIMHDLGYTTTEWIVVGMTSDLGVGVPPTYWGFIRLLTVDSRQAVFQLSVAAVTQKLTFKVAPMTSSLIPPGASEAADVQ